MAEETITIDETESFVVDDGNVKATEPAESNEIVQETDTPEESTVTEQSEVVEQEAESSEEKQTNVNKRIGKVVRQREDAKREVERLKAENEGLKAKREADVEDDFGSYLDDLDETEEAGKPTLDPVKEEAPGQSESLTTAKAVIGEFLSNATLPADFESIAMSPDVPVTESMVEALSLADDPASILYYLGQHKDLAKEISDKSPAQQARAIAQLENKAVPKKQVKTTKAPAPISPVGVSDTSKKSLHDMEFNDFEAERNKADRRR